MRQRCALVLAAVALAVLVTGQRASAEAGLDALRSGVLDRISNLRLAHGLSALEVDSIRTAVFQRRLQDAVATADDAILQESTWTVILDRVVYDWERWDFAATGISATEILRVLEGSHGFRDAALNPDASHLVVGAVDLPTGGTWCAVSISRRLTELGVFEADVALRGPTFLTVSGESPYRRIRVRFYNSDVDPDIYEGDDWTLDLDTGENGLFKARLPISKFGAGDYQVVFYVRDESEADYRIAARTHFRVQSWSNAASDGGGR